MWASAGPGPSSSSTKQWKSDACVKIYKSVSARWPLKKKNYYREHCNIKARVLCIFNQIRLNIKARHEKRDLEFLNANPWLIHLIIFNIDWSWNILTLHNFCSMLIKQLSHWPENVRSDNLKIRTLADLQNRVMDGLLVTQ